MQRVNLTYSTYGCRMTVDYRVGCIPLGILPNACFVSSVKPAHVDNGVREVRSGDFVAEEITLPDGAE
ncbi:MAG: hypothetical protein Q7R40_13905, partial [Phaeospirillum sp.]|nr:hypothetical protein [Phaeospirillum sp.]